jgi:hypothetical protein
MWCEIADWINLAQDEIPWRALVSRVSYWNFYYYAYQRIFLSVEYSFASQGPSCVELICKGVEHLLTHVCMYRRTPSSQCRAIWLLWRNCDLQLPFSPRPAVYTNSRRRPNLSCHLIHITYCKQDWLTPIYTWNVIRHRLSNCVW